MQDLTTNKPSQGVDNTIGYLFSIFCNMANFRPTEMFSYDSLGELEHKINSIYPTTTMMATTSIPFGWYLYKTLLNKFNPTKITGDWKEDIFGIQLHFEHKTKESSGCIVRPFSTAFNFCCKDRERNMRALLDGLDFQLSVDLTDIEYLKKIMDDEGYIRFPSGLELRLRVATEDDIQKMGGLENLHL